MENATRDVLGRDSILTVPYFPMSLHPEEIVRDRGWTQAGEDFEIQIEIEAKEQWMALCAKKVG